MELRVRSYGNESYFLSVRPVAPEQSVRPRRAVLYVSFEDLLTLDVWVFNRVVLVRVETWMPGIIQKQLHALLDVLEESLGFRSLRTVVLPPVRQ